MKNVLFQEVGIQYTHTAKDAPQHFYSYVYTWRHVDDNETGRKTVYIGGNFDDFVRLLTHWNRQGNFVYIPA